MNGTAIFWRDFYSWSLALGFILVLTVIVIFTVLAAVNGMNLFAPLIRAFESRQRHRHEMAKMRLRAELARKGMDPDYVAFMQKEVEKG